MTALAIVSSYSDSCGNAAFTRVLRETIEQYSDVQVHVIDLDIPLLQSTDRAALRVADRYIAAICRQLRQFDAVNIQVETGLYGTYPEDIYRRLSSLFRANPRTSVTLHSPRIMGAGSQTRAAIKDFFALRFKSAVTNLLSSMKSGVHIRLNKRVIRRLIANNCSAIVHTERAKRQIAAIFDFHDVVVHPLRIVREDFSSDPSVISGIRQQLAIDPAKKVIGMFGYLTANKGHLDALDAIERLPDDYVLLIFGRQHPQTIKSDGSKDPYLEKIIRRVRQGKKLWGRVFFLGELSDDEFTQVASGVDVAWLPYYENGQDGSGIASICMDVAPRVLASASFAFDELQRLIPYSNVMRFDIGNHIELATKTEMIMRREVPSKPYGDESRFNICQQAMVYANAARPINVEQRQTISSETRTLQGAR